MRTVSCTLAIALILLATDALSQSKTPLQQCREDNQYNLTQLQERTNAAARNFDLTSAQGRQLLDERNALRGVPGQAGNLANCREKATKIAALGEKTTQMINASDKALAACRRDAREKYIAVQVAVENEQGRKQNTGRLTPENNAEFSKFQAGIQDAIVKGEDRPGGFTMADCNLQKARIANYRAYFESICFKDLYTQGRPTVCLKVQ